MKNIFILILSLSMPLSAFAQNNIMSCAREIVKIFPTDVVFEIGLEACQKYTKETIDCAVKAGKSLSTSVGFEIGIQIGFEECKDNPDETIVQ